MLNNYNKQHILSYGGNLRTLKNKMDKNNIKYLIENNEYLYKESTFTTTKWQGIYLCTVTLLNEKKYKYG